MIDRFCRVHIVFVQSVSAKSDAEPASDAVQLSTAGCRCRRAPTQRGRGAAKPCENPPLTVLRLLHIHPTIDDRNI